jgi:acetylornithine deacetylase
VNAVAIALKDINWLLTHSMEKVSPLLGPVKWTPTIINTENTKHNVVPDRCTFTIDCRINELYSHEEVLHHLTTQLSAELTPRSMKLRSSQIEETHPIVRSGRALGLESYGSPTCSDKGLMPFPALKIGPGDSARSHTPDEFIYLDEIEQGISLYLQLLHQFNTYCS